MLMSAVAVGVTVALASLVCYLAMRSELRAQVDRRLRAQGELVQRIGALRGGTPPARSSAASWETSSSSRAATRATHRSRTWPSTRW
jgi:hypothetical protein